MSTTSRLTHATEVAKIDTSLGCEAMVKGADTWRLGREPMKQCGYPPTKKVTMLEGEGKGQSMLFCDDCYRAFSSWATQSFKTETV